jgi:hypothetical protein
MKRIGMPHRLLHGNWSDECYVLYSDVMSNTTTIHSIWRLIRRTLMSNDIRR